MKKLLLFALCVFAQNLLHAQPWMPASNNGPMKYSDALARYYAYIAKTGNDDDATIHHGKEEQEDKNHLFEVWNYYWKKHLDKNGYMVPPAQNVVNWQNYLQTHSAGGAARSTATAANWVFQGPDTCSHGYSGLGRINIVAFDPVDSNTFYVGSAGSNAWKTTDGGNTWMSMYDYLPMQGVADIKINPLNRNTIYIATGDGDAADAYSSGVIVSHDAGLHWATTGLSWLPSLYYSAHCILINPLDTTSMMLASTNGLYKSHDGGLTWTNIFSGSFKQIIYNPADTAIVYGAMYTDTFAQIMRSADGGNTWAAVTSYTDAQRINLAVCPANPAIVKAIVSNQSSGLEGFYSSSDSGQTFIPLVIDTGICTNNLLSYDLGLPATACSGQAWYDLCIAINPANPNEVTVGGVNTYYSSDGGSSWTLANQWYGGLTGVSTVHADKHCLAYNPLSGGLYETCDGGIYKNYGPTTSPWIDLTNGISITEFYRVAVNNNVSFVIGGAQDNGTKLIDAGFSEDLVGGDGMQPLINPLDPNNTWYASYQYGATFVTRDAGNTWTSISDTIHGTGGWISPYIVNPADTANILMAYNQVYITHNSGLSWTSISPVFDTDASNPGITIDRMVVAPSNPNVIYATYYDYNIWTPYIRYTTDLGTTWHYITMPFISLISDIVVDPRNENKIWVTCPWYGYDKIWAFNLTTNTWTNQTGDLPDIPVECMIIDSSSLTQYVGTDAAVFYKDTSMVNWALYNTDLPCVHIEDLQINYATNQLWAATYGRGMWATTKVDHTPTAIKQVSLNANDITVYPNPATTQLTVQSTNQPISKITITNLLGQTLYSLQYNSLQVNVNIAALAPGMYFVKVNDGEVRKFVKE